MSQEVIQALRDLRDATDLDTRRTIAKHLLAILLNIFTGLTFPFSQPNFDTQTDAQILAWADSIDSWTGQWPSGN